MSELHGVVDCRIGRAGVMLVDVDRAVPDEMGVLKSKVEKSLSVTVGPFSLGHGVVSNNGLDFGLHSRPYLPG